MRKYLQNRTARLAPGVTAVALTFGATAPAALADVDFDNEALYLDASQVQIATALQSGDTNAAADDGSAVVVSQGIYIDQTQVNGGLGDLDLDGVSDVRDGDGDNDGFLDIFE